MALLKGSDREILSRRVHFVTKFAERVRIVISAPFAGVSVLLTVGTMLGWPADLSSWVWLAWCHAAVPDARPGRGGRACVTPWGRCRVACVCHAQAAECPSSSSPPRCTLSSSARLAYFHCPLLRSVAVASFALWAPLVEVRAAVLLVFSPCVLSVLPQIHLQFVNIKTNSWTRVSSYTILD